MSHDSIFWATLSLPLIAAVLFNRSWLKYIQRNARTYPFEVFVYIYFIIVPATNVVFDEYVNYSLFFESPAKAMADLNILNACGLLLAAVSARWIKVTHNFSLPRQAPIGNINLYLMLALIASLAMGLYNNFFAFNLRATGSDLIEGGIARYALIEAAPMLLSWFIVISVWKNGKRPATVTALSLLALFLIVAVAMNFSRGSRVTVLLVVILGFQLFHMHIVRLRAPVLIAVVIVGALVFNLMTVYKHLGIGGVSSYVSGERLPTYVSEQYTDPVRIVIGDIGRSDIQASIFEAELSGQIPHAHGKTYLKALTLVAPDSLDPFPNDWSKVVVGALAQISIDPGVRLFSNDTWGISSSRIYGMAGEAMLNFGLIGALLSFVGFGLVTRWTMLFANGSGGWERALLAPTASLVPVLILFYDFDNMIFRIIMLLGLPGGLLVLNRFLGARRPSV